MRKLLYLANMLLVLMMFSSCSKSTEPMKINVLQFNIWQEGTSVEGGYEGIISQILQAEADIVFLSEVRNYNDTRFCDRIVKSLQDSGQVFYSFYSEDSGILTRFPIKDSTVVYPLQNDAGSAYRALVDIDGQELALYTTHLDYRNCAYYDVLGYDGSTWKERPRLLDVDSILMLNVMSKRDDGMTAIIAHGNKDREAGRIVLIGGDYNEPSFLDWQADTKDMFDHGGIVVDWTVTKMLDSNNYKDAYREMYPNAVTHPGFTFPSQNALVPISRLAWAPKSDERERVDYIHYSPSPKLKLVDAVVWGPKKSISNNEVVLEDTQDPFRIGAGVWPTDHKAVLVTFELSK